MSPLARHIFNADDDNILKYLKDDNQKIEPEWYMPIIPMVLVNGAEGIGTGWSTKIPNYNPREIVQCIIQLLDGKTVQELKPLVPWYKGFTGTIEELDFQRYVSNGEISHLSDTKIEITELPIKTWTDTYKKGVLEEYLIGTDKIKPKIEDYSTYGTDTTVKFVVQMAAAEKRNQELGQGLHSFFKLQGQISTTSMVLFDQNKCIKRYDDVRDILQEFFVLRLEYYAKRKRYLVGLKGAEAQKFSNQARFIIEKCDRTLVVENKKRKKMIEELAQRGYDADPMKKWQKALAAEQEEEEVTNPFKHIMQLESYCVQLMRCCCKIIYLLIHLCFDL